MIVLGKERERKSHILFLCIFMPAAIKMNDVLDLKFSQTKQYLNGEDLEGFFPLL